MDAITDPSVFEVWVKKSAQVGWTEIINNTLGYFIHQDPAPIMVVQPTKDAAEDWSRDRLAPMLRDTPVLAERISDLKSRSSSNTLRHKTFPGGVLALAISNSPSSLASKPIRILCFDEVDKYPRSAKQAGDPIRLGKKRTTSFWNRKVLGGSTPTIKGVSKIDAQFELSDQRFYFVPCPHCKEKQRLIWAQVKWTDKDPETAGYLCQHCGVLWSDVERREAVAHGEWRATKPSKGIAGFHLNELLSPFVRLSEMVANFMDSKDLPETLQQFVNESLGEVFESTAGTTVDADKLTDRCEQYTAASVPGGVLMLTAGCDTQDDRVEVQLEGWGVGEENWIVEHKVFYGDPGKPALWKEVDDYLLERRVTEDGRTLLVEAVAVDSGGHHTQAVYDFVVSRKRRRVWAIKGMGGAGRLAWPKKASRTAKSRAMVYIIGVDTIKGVLYGRLTKQLEPGPGYIHLPAMEADEAKEFCRQLTSEKCFTKYVRGRPTMVWEPREKNIRQEAQDCWNYGYAAFVGRRGPELIARMAKRLGLKQPERKPEAAPIAASNEPTPDTVDEPQTPQPQRIEPTPQPQRLRMKRPRRGGFMSRW